MILLTQGLSTLLTWALPTLLIKAALSGCPNGCSQPTTDTSSEGWQASCEWLQGYS